MGNGQPSLRHLWARASALRLEAASSPGGAVAGLVAVGPEDVDALAPLFRAQRALCRLLADRGKGPLGDFTSVQDLALTLEDLGVGVDRLHYEHRAHLRARAVLEQLTALEMECAELRDWLPWKTWKTYPASTPDSRAEQQEEVAAELADILHFLVNIAMLMGIDERQLAACYLAKHEENVARVNGGY